MVAIKTVSKNERGPFWLFEQKREIEILRMCQHKNIIKLIDVFENEDQISIVMEQIRGKDLWDYCNMRKNFIEEEKVKRIVY